MWRLLGISLQHKVGRNMSEPLVLTDSVIISMANNQEIVAEFPFFKSIIRKPVKKSGCCPTANTLEPSLKIARHTIQQLSKDRLSKLKALAKVDQFVIVNNKGNKVFL